MNNKKQTAVEWLENQIDYLLENYDVHSMQYHLEKAYAQAKAMEKEQHKESYWESLMSKYQTFEQYYKETYDN